MHPHHKVKAILIFPSVNTLTHGSPHPHLQPQWYADLHLHHQTLIGRVWLLLFCSHTTTNSDIIIKAQRLLEGNATLLTTQMAGEMVEGCDVIAPCLILSSLVTSWAGAAPRHDSEQQNRKLLSVCGESIFARPHVVRAPWGWGD